MDKATDNTLPAEIERDGPIGVMLPADLNPAGSIAPVWTSRRPETDLDRAQLLASLTGRLPKLSEKIGETLFIVHVTRQSVTLVNRETGEVSDAIRTILTTDKGEHYSAVSDGITSSLAMVCQLWGPPPWTPPLPLKMRQFETAAGRRYYYLEYDIEDSVKRKSRSH